MNSPRRRTVALFVAASAAYFVAYAILYAGRLSDYWSDALRHFPFLRRLLG